MAKPLHALLTRREREIMDVLLRRGRATAAEVMNDLPGGQTYSTIRTQLRVLEDKGYIRHEDDGVRYVYTLAVNRKSARQSALKHLVDTFFDGSAGQAVAALLGGEASRISDEELDRLADLIADAKAGEVKSRRKREG
jgi:predicted transcriptional regulator